MSSDLKKKSYLSSDQLLKNYVQFCSPLITFRSSSSKNTHSDWRGKNIDRLSALKWPNIINNQWELAISGIMWDRESCWCNKDEQGKWAVMKCGNYQWDCRQWSDLYSRTSWLNNTGTLQPPATYTCELHSLRVHRVWLRLKGWSGSALRWEKDSRVM